MSHYASYPGANSRFFVFATAGEAVDVAGSELVRRAEHWQAASGLNLLPTIARLRQAGRLRRDRLLL